MVEPMIGPARLILHIGAGKCGSSAIQEFLAANAAELTADGVLVPGRHLTVEQEQSGMHLQYFESGIGRPGFADEVSRRLIDLHHAVSAMGYRAVVISAENLINPKGFVDLFTGVTDLFDVRIVAYVRRQDDFAISAWQQWQVKQHDDFWDYYRKARGRIDWYGQLEPFRRTYGRDHMIVRRFFRDGLIDGDVVADFCDVIGVDVTSYLRPGSVNRSLHERFNPLLARFRSELFTSIHDNRFYRFLGEVLGDGAYKDYPGSSLLTLAQRRMIMADHDRSNNKLKTEYFPELGDGPLFPPPRPADVHTPSEAPMDDATQLLYVGMFKLWSRMDGCEATTRAVVTKSTA